MKNLPAPVIENLQRLLATEGQQCAALAATKSKAAAAVAERNRLQSGGADPDDSAAVRRLGEEDIRVTLYANKITDMERATASLHQSIVEATLTAIPEMRRAAPLLVAEWNKQAQGEFMEQIAPHAPALVVKKVKEFSGAMTKKDYALPGLESDIITLQDKLRTWFRPPAAALRPAVALEAPSVARRVVQLWIDFIRQAPASPDTTAARSLAS